MAERNISVRLRAEVGEFRRALGQGVLSLKEMQAAAAKTESVMGKAKSEMATAAKRVEAAEKQLARTQKDSTKTASQKAAAEVKLQNALDKHKKATDAAVQAEAKHRVSLQQVAKAQETAATAAGRTAQRIKDNTDAYQKAGGVLAAAGAATTGLVVATVKTGVAYNSLQQSSRAALKTMLGGAEAVTAQMGELDKFARTSPFSKQTFISAQQQMLAFGIESQKVIPYLSAINDATAAAGGNSQMLGELAFVMAQISAAGKITGQDLIQFGQRGVNAAELIGSQMGLTGAEIKAHITEGTLGADVALDALAAGMSEKFAGASANVKATWDGATDRVRSAIRDISALLAAPLVDPESGGAAVGWANGLADALRNVEGRLEAMPKGVRVVASALVAAGGGATTLAGGLLLALPRIIATREAMNALAASGSKIPGVFKGAGKAAGAAALAIGTFAAFESLGNYEQNAGVFSGATDEITQALERLRKTGDATDLDAMFAGKGNWMDFSKQAGDQATAIGGLSDALERFEVAMQEDRSGGPSIFTAFNESGRGLFNTSAWNQAVESMQKFDETLAGLVRSGDAEALAAAEQYLAESASKAGLSFEYAASGMPEYQKALEEAGAAAGETGTQTLQAALDVEEAAKRAEEAQKALEAAFESFSGLYGDAAAAFIDLGGAYDVVVEKNKALAQSTADATKDSKDSWEDYFDDFPVKVSDYIAELEAQVKAQGEWKQNMVTLAGKVSEETLAELAQLGPAGAPLVAELVNATDKELSRLDLATVAKNETDAFVRAIAGAQENIPMLKVLADMGLARTALDHFVNDAQRRQIRLNVTANTGGLGRLGVTAKATGGSVVGPGTGTSDSIPALLSNGEHVLTASDVAKAGGQGAVYRMRGLIQAGALRFAVGGEVGAASRAVSNAAKARDAAKRAVAAEKRDVAAAERAHDRASGTWAKKRAQSNVNAQKKQLEAAEKRLRAAEKRLDDATARYDRLQVERRDFAVERGRGSVVDQVSSGLSGGLSVVDRVRDMSRSGDYSAAARKRLSTAAYQAERDLTRQYALLEKTNEKISEQSALLNDVKGMRDQIAQQMMGEVKLSGLLGQRDAHGYDLAVTPGAIKAYVTDKLAKARKFNSSLDALRKKGAPNALLQEVLGAGIEGGTALADALLSSSGSDWRSITSSWSALERESLRTGDISTQSAFGTTTAVVERQLASSVAAAEGTQAAIEKIGKGLQTAIGKPLGFARGGLVSGSGTGTSDSIAARLSDGEFVVNARSTAANLNALERINATPGPVAAPVVAMPMSSGPDWSSVSFHIEVSESRGAARVRVLNGLQEIARTDRAALTMLGVDR